MSTAQDRLDVIQNNYTDALQNEPNDLAQAQSAADVTAIQANVASARSTYYGAVAATLTNNAGGVETAFNDAKAAVASVQQARTAAAQIPTLLGTLNNATQKATALLQVAKV